MQASNSSAAFSSRRSSKIISLHNLYVESTAEIAKSRRRIPKRSDLQNKILTAPAAIQTLYNSTVRVADSILIKLSSPRYRKALATYLQDKSANSDYDYWFNLSASNEPKVMRD
jgi:hypothetical protein